jgi:hypothetical protein
VPSNGERRAGRWDGRDKISTIIISKLADLAITDVDVL